MLQVNIKFVLLLNRVMLIYNIGYDENVNECQVTHLFVTS